jgi:hypothetical protein
MSEIWIAITVFVCLSAASVGSMYVSAKMPVRHRDDGTAAIIKSVANIFVVMTSLVFGLMVNSSKNTFETMDNNVHAYATNLILLDRTLRTYGLSGKEARDHLLAYVEQAIANPVRADDALESRPDRAGQALDSLGDVLMTIQPADSYHQSLILDIRQQYRRLVEQRWAIIEQSQGTIPRPLIRLLLAWLILIFGSFGYGAPRNEIVFASFIVSALLIAGAFYLVLDMDVPFRGPIQVSDAPLQRALAEMKS